MCFTSTMANVSTAGRAANQRPQGTPTPPYLEKLRQQHGQLQRTSTADRVAAILREQITDSALLPGDRLPEDGISAALQVSRNTLREAFRLLSHERLVVHELNRGVFVRSLTLSDVVDLYQMRRLLECGVLREVAGRQLVLTAVSSAVTEGYQAAAQQRWSDVGTANMHFHQAIVALANSPRATETMRGLNAELRLIFHVMHNPRAFHKPYLARNREIYELLETTATHAADVLDTYLHDAERQLVDAYRAYPTQKRSVNDGSAT